jgi:tRNA(Arg) A34 adenosine deaminase TadA
MKAQFMQEAIRLSGAKMRQGLGGPFGAVIVQNNKIIGRGWNRVTARNDPTAHAEVMAIRSACRRLKTFQLSDCEIYTSCEPCPMCLAAIYWARIKTVYFANTRTDAARAGFDDDWIYHEVSQPISQRKIHFEQLMPVEAGKVFAEWAVLPGKIPY